ncbi:hypothetical protein [Alcaligenes aquatilis]|uniref:hypothetical protein n=1 Tax=Alcaligenes aquatilis TaxID=323284 RepID=UPI003F91BFAA
MSIDTKKLDITHRLRCRYPLGPIQANGEPEFGWRDFSGPALEGMVLPTAIMLEAANRIDAQADEMAQISRHRDTLKIQCEQHINDASRLRDALDDLLTDMVIAQGNMRDAAKHDSRWEGCAEAIQPRVDAARAALSGEPA